MKVYANIISDIPDKNGRIYPKEVLKKAIDEYQARIKNKNSIGTLGAAPHEMSCKLDDAAFLIKAANLVGEKIELDVDLLDTLKGKLAKDYLERNPIVTAVGIGTVNEHGIVQSDYKISYFSHIIF